jgi:sugar-specific transcriptional regulator TrmB
MNAALSKPTRTDQVDNLVDLGFTKVEALAYLILLDEHPATAYEISKRGALTKAHVYTALASLVQKGVAQPVSEAPLRYAPVDPRTLFNRIARNTASLCDDLAVSLTTREQQKALDYVWIVAGEQRLHKKIVDMIEGAREQIWIKAPHYLIAPYADALRKASRSGVSILVILFGTPADAKRLGLGTAARVYLHEGSGEMLAVGQTQFVIATDWQESLISDFGPEPQGAYTRSQAVVFMAETMIRHEVYLAEIINAFGPAIEKRFGKDLLSLRQHYLPAKLRRKAQNRSRANQPRRRAATTAITDTVNESV